jgi:hypothetical protein
MARIEAALPEMGESMTEFSGRCSADASLKQLADTFSNSM